MFHKNGFFVKWRDSLHSTKKSREKHAGKQQNEITGNILLKQGK